MRNVLQRIKRWMVRDQAPAVPRASAQVLRYPGASAAAFGQGLSLATYEEMLCDPLVRSAVTVKKLGTLAVPWRIEPAEGERTHFIRFALDELHGSANMILFDALDAIAKGFAVLEKVFRPVTSGGFGGKVILGAVKPKDPALFGFDTDEFLNLRGLYLHVPGHPEVRLPREKFIVYAYNRRYHQPMGESDLRAAHSHWKVKRELIRQWSAHLEKYASPTVLGRFRRGLPEDAQTALLDALERLQRQAAVVHPDDVEISLLDAGREARSSYLEAIDYHNREIARAILGETLTTDDSRKVGSLALGKVHLQVLVMQLAGLRKDLQETVMNEQVIRPLIDLNYGGGPYPSFQFDEPVLDVFVTGQVV
jgi:phage gp29-like protein